MTNDNAAILFWRGCRHSDRCSATGLDLTPAGGRSQLASIITTMAIQLASPALAVTSLWLAITALVAMGPLAYPGQPSVSALTLVTIGVSTFLVGYWIAGRGVAIWLRQRSVAREHPCQPLDKVVVISAVLGLGGIALIALDRTLLSGINNGDYAALLRCAPTLVDSINIKRTPLIYVGYLTFSFGLTSFALFVLNGERISGWTAWLAQLSIISPVGYALLYSGRMPILLAITLVAGVILARLAQGRKALPGGHHLAVKAMVFLVLFAVYTTSMWSIRKHFCTQMGSLISRLEIQIRDFAALQNKEVELASKASRLKSSDDGKAPDSQVADRPSIESELATTRAALAKARAARSAYKIEAAELNSMIDQAKSPEQVDKSSADFSELARVIERDWHVNPRGYVASAIETGYISIGTATSFLSSYFYLTHGMYILDLIWHSREKLTPLWGVYEVGILSPIIRLFLPHSQRLASMDAQLRAAEIYGFFPSAWGAAYIDFGAVGAIIYILAWGAIAGAGFHGSRRTNFVTPPLLLAFSLSSILLSPLQGPLGVANSALVLASMVIAGLAVDLTSFGNEKKGDNSIAQR